MYIRFILLVFSLRVCVLILLKTTVKIMNNGLKKNCVRIRKF